MTQYSLIEKLAKEGFNAKEIFLKLKEIFEPDNISYSSVTYHLRMGICKPVGEVSKNFGGRPPNYRIDQLILKALEENPSQGYRKIADMIGVDPSSVYYVLTNRLGFKSYHIQMIPYELNLRQKNSRVIISQTLKSVVEQAKRNKWKFILTGDESWFYYNTNHELVWLPKGTKPRKIQKVMINSPKVMVTIFWNPHGAPVIDILNPGQSFTADYFVEHILKEILLLPEYTKAKTKGRNFVVHMDNSPIHKAKATQKFLMSNNLTMPMHPAYSPDLAPSDFYLFGKLKNKLKGIAFASADNLKAAIEDEFDNISHDELERVFEEWLERLNKVIKVKGDYIEEI